MSDPSAPAFRHLLIATDGSEVAQRAVDEGVRLAAALGAQVTILAVVEPLNSLGGRDHAWAGLPEDAREQALDFVNQEARQALDSGLACALAHHVGAHAALVEGGQIDNVIVGEASKRSADLIVMGSHGRRGIAALFLGSVAQKVLTQATMPVLIVRYQM